MNITLRPHIAWVILKKEALEVLRDRKTLFLIIGIPLLLYPMLGIVTSEVAMGQAAKIKSQPSRVALLGAPAPEPLLKRLKEDPEIDLVPAPKKPRFAIQQRDLDAAIHIPDTFAAERTLNQGATLSISFDSIEPLSDQAMRRVRAHTQTWSDETRDATLYAHKLSPKILHPIILEPRDVATSSQQSSSVLVGVLPLMILVFMVTGAFYPAVDLTAGERERKTIQTLLTSPIKTLEIIAGKYLVVVSMSLISGLANLLSISLLIAYGVSLSSSSTAFGVSFTFTPAIVAGLVLSVTLFGLLVSSILIAIASFSARPKDAQSTLSIAYILSILPATLASLPGIELTPVTSLVPIMNLSLLMRGIVLSQATLSQVFIVSLVTCVYTFIGLFITSKIYARQDILIQDTSDLKLWLTPGAQPHQATARRAPPLDLSFALLGTLILLLFYIGGLLQSWDILAGLTLSLWGLIFLPSVLFTKLTRSDWKTTFHLQAPNALQLFGAGLLGVSSFIWLSTIIGLFHEQFLPIPQPFIEAMEEIFVMPNDIAGRALVFLVMAVSPAICEEALFRGVLLSSLREKTGMWTSIILSGILFGLFHLSIYRLLGTATLGVLMGYLVWTSRSIWPAVLFHALNNGMSLFTQDLRKALSPNETIGLLVASVVATLAGLGFFALGSRDTEDDTETHTR